MRNSLNVPLQNIDESVHSFEHLSTRNPHSNSYLNGVLLEKFDKVLVSHDFNHLSVNFISWYKFRACYCSMKSLKDTRVRDWTLGLGKL